MIVYGWRNYDKRNSRFRRDTCQQCERSGNLVSYSATRWFHVYYVPLFPMSRKRVVDQCPSCELAREMPLRRWHRLRRKELKPALERADKHPADPEAIERALGLVCQLGSREEFVKIVHHVADHHLDNAGLLAKLGWAFHYFNLPSEGDESLRRSLAIEESESVQELADRFAAQTPLPAPRLPSRLTEILPLLIMPAITLVAITWFILASAMEKPERVYLVNGLDRPYDVLVNGELVTAPALSQMRLDVDYGSLEVSPVQSNPALTPVSTRIEAPFLKRIGKGPPVVINPDATAVLLWEEAVYVANREEVDAEEENRIQLHSGKSLYEFENVDALFAPLPESVHLSSISDRTYRRAVRQLTDENPSELFAVLVKNDQTEEAVNYAKSQLSFNPANDDLLLLFVSYSAPVEAAEFLESRLEDRPVLVEWHRYFQELADRVYPERNLVSYYRTALEKEPDNRDLAYLLGRVITNPKAALTVLTQATRPPEPSAYAFHAIAYHHMNRAEFEKALEFESKARELEPENPQFMALEEEMLLATGNFEELIRRRRAALEESPLDRDAAINLHFALAIAGERREANKLAGAFITRLAGETDLETGDAERLRAVFEANIALATGNRLSFMEHCGKAGGGEWAYFAAVAEGDLVRARQELDQAESSEWINQLLLYALAEEDGRTSFAKDRLTQAVQSLARGSKEQRAAARWFAQGGAAPGLEDVYGMRGWPDETRIVLTALGYRFPRMKDVYFPVARKLNYNPAFPGLLLEDVLGSPTESASASEP